MQTFKTAILATSVVVLAGCSSFDQCGTTRNDWFCSVQGTQSHTAKTMAATAPDDTAARLAAREAERQRLADEQAAARKENGTFSSRVSEPERQLADANQAKGSLAKAEKDLLKSLQPEIKAGHVSVHQSGDQLIINLASSMLFDSGQAQLKSSGADALKRVGTVLTHFPEKSVHVAGYTDNVAIKGPLQKKFPSNKKLSDARAKSAALALRDDGVRSNLSAAGHGASNPVASNNTAAGRAKNRRVEVIVK